MESTKAPVAPALTLEEKAWFEQRKKDLQQYSSIGAATGAVVSAAITFVGPFPRRYQIATILGSSLIGSLSGYLWADTKSLERINDLSATSQLRKQLTKIQQTKKAAEAATAAAKAS
ncbi:hypothetical protein H310_06937 [Aphanomyces invadans]|uniref:Uncharacterized protein n=1 Tax=Aphanomyces invadans TaxID=157072 RepID=A0A024U741_9STRA|nr:hypothetical protein H310_06937 [Aphanomyces invadans]ETW01388.1 hypothetical protein H310_06937 [Aphanomyces invadans]|eukprot:XP_008870386.1 hypothetical protein H310_06937 [Aphanomyces invadans]